MFAYTPLGMASSAMRGAGMIGILFLVYNWIKNNCTCFRKADIRRIPGVAFLFLKLGIDPYPEFPVIFTVHSVKDVDKGSKMYAMVYAKYESFKTRSVSTGKWEQSSRLLVPQGTSEVEISIYSSKMLSGDDFVGSCSINVAKYFMGGYSADFYGKKKWHKLAKVDGGTAGSIGVTFKKGSDSLEEEKPLLSGLDPDERPALYGEIIELFEDNPARNVRGEEKLQILAKVLQGKLTRVGKGLGGSEEIYCAVVKMTPPADSEDSDEGPRTGKLKWFWAWYESKKDFTDNPGDPEGCVPILSITAIHANPEKQGEFSLRYVSKPDNKKKETFYKSPDKDVEVWSDGIELFREEARELKGLAKAREEEWMKLNQQQKMEEWMAHYKSQGYSDEELKKYYKEYQLAQMPENQRRKYLEAMAAKAVSSPN